MKTYKTLTIYATLVLLQLVAIAFTITKLKSLEDVVTTEPVLIDSLNTTIALNVVLLVLLIGMVGWTVLDAIGYYNNSKKKSSNWQDFIQMMGRHNRISTPNAGFGKSAIFAERVNNRSQDKTESKTPADIMSDVLGRKFDVSEHDNIGCEKKSIKVDEEPNDRPRREDYPIGEEGKQMFDNAFVDWTLKK